MAKNIAFQVYPGKCVLGSGQRYYSHSKGIYAICKYNLHIMVYNFSSNHPLYSFMC